MKWLADENIPNSAVALLRQRGQEVFSVLYDGLLTVTEAEKYRATLKAVIGPINLMAAAYY